MRTGVIAMIALCLSVIVATAQTDQTDQTVMWAIGEVAREMHLCGNYFAIVSQCIKPQRPDVAVTYQQRSDKVMALAIPGQLAAGLSDKAILAENTAYVRAMMNDGLKNGPHAYATDGRRATAPACRNAIARWCGFVVALASPLPKTATLWRPLFYASTSSRFSNAVCWTPAGP